MLKMLNLKACMLIVPESIENTDSSFYALKFYTDITIH